MSYSGGDALSAKADGADTLQAGDMVEAEDLDIQIISAIFMGSAISISPG